MSGGGVKRKQAETFDGEEPLRTRFTPDPNFHVEWPTQGTVHEADKKLLNIFVQFLILEIGKSRLMPQEGLPARREVPARYRIVPLVRDARGGSYYNILVTYPPSVYVPWQLIDGLRQLCHAYFGEGGTRVTEDGLLEIYMTVYTMTEEAPRKDFNFFMWTAPPTASSTTTPPPASPRGAGLGSLLGRFLGGGGADGAS